MSELEWAILGHNGDNLLWVHLDAVWSNYESKVFGPFGKELAFCEVDLEAGRFKPFEYFADVFGMLLAGPGVY